MKLFMASQSPDLTIMDTMEASVDVVVLDIVEIAGDQTEEHVSLLARHLGAKLGGPEMT